MQTTRTTWLSLALALALAGCGDGDGGGGGSSTFTKVTDMEEPLINAMCSKIEECVPSLEVFFTPWTCEDFARMNVSASLAASQRRVDNGELTFDPAKARACIDELNALACSDLYLDGGPFGPAEACREALTGNKAAGESCSDDAECAPSLYCDRSMACPGTCAEPIAAGGSCRDEQRCADGQRCFVPDGSTDGMGTCMTPADEGEACDTEMGPPCARSLRCQTDGDSTAGTCGREFSASTDAAMGEACGVIGRGLTLCADGLVCAISTGFMGTCQADGLGEGEACPFAIPDPCGDGLYCDGAMPGGPTGMSTMGTCKKMPAAGEPCGQVSGLVGDDGPFEDGLCAPGLACDQTASTPTCVEPKPNGQPCRSDLICASNYCETAPDDDTGTCMDAPLCR